MSDGFTILDRLIRATSLRHGVLSENIANVDTPGYKAKDVKFNGLLDSEMGLVVTDQHHLSTGGPGSQPEIENAEDAQAWPDKNDVELDQEVAKMTENSMLFQAGVSLLETKIRMFKNALK
jgi:flagellar basal-body rod protein FlgB